MKLVGIDTGGTFTDFVYIDGNALRIHKELSTPHAPECAVRRGLDALGIDLDGTTRIVHGSTVATNAVLERKGARTVFVTNRGLRDLLTIGRQARRELYELKPQVIAPPVPRALCLETGGRLSATGEIIDPLSTDDIRAVADEIRRLKPRAVAITLLFSFLDDRFERALAAAMPAEVFVSYSADVLPEHREYERAVATWLNSYVGPVMQGYLSSLATELHGARLSVMQSSGVTCDPDFAGRRAVNLLLSGPAGGLQGARHIAAAAERTRLVTFDMGGTSTDVALIDGRLSLTSEGTIGAYPVGVPMVDMHTIGAGGGSIAHVDAGGLLHVGPASAGAIPGPACYGQGGRETTVTDANLVLGRIPRDIRLGGTLELDFTAAQQAVAALAARLGGITAHEAAAGVIRIANEHMQQALRVISVERGVDPRDYTLVSFGGAGGLHVCALADALGMRQALVPVHAGVLSALGMLAAPPGRQLSKTVRKRMDELSDEAVASTIDEIGGTGYAALAEEGFSRDALESRASVDLCYLGQSFSLNIPWQSCEQAQAAFHQAHESRYGHRLAAPVQLVSVRLGLISKRELTPPPRHAPSGPLRTAGASQVIGVTEPVAVWERRVLVAGHRLEGPAIVIDDVGTSYIEPNWNACVDVFGNLSLGRG